MTKRNTIHLLFIPRIFVGAVFIFSGFVKGVDPLGTVYKINDYLFAIGITIPDSLSLILSYGLNGFEFLLGFALILNIFPVFFTWMAFLFMLFSIPLTLVLAIYNPVTDCGCFGDAIILSNWETFYKNVILSVFVIVLFLFITQLNSRLSINKQAVLISLSALGFLMLMHMCDKQLPMIDFRPYKIGTYIPDGMIIPENAPEDSFRTILVYKNGAETKNFMPENVPWQDTTWKWIETKTELIRPGYHPPIHDFSFTDLSGQEITDDLIYDSSPVFLAISYHLGKADKQGLQKLIPEYEFCKITGFI